MGHAPDLHAIAEGFAGLSPGITLVVEFAAAL